MIFFSNEESSRLLADNLSLENHYRHATDISMLSIGSFPARQGVMHVIYHNVDTSKVNESRFKLKCSRRRRPA